MECLHLQAFLHIELYIMHETQEILIEYTKRKRNFKYENDNFK